MGSGIGGEAVLGGGTVLRYYIESIAEPTNKWHKAGGVISHVMHPSVPFWGYL